MQVEKIDPTWMRFNRNTFTISDRDKIPDGSRLNDRHINYAQNIIKCQFSIKGLQSTLLQSTSRLPISELQIVHSKGNHCIVASTILTKPNSVDVYDSLYNSIDPESLKTIQNLFGIKEICMVEVQKQEGCDDCGLFAIAYAVYLAKKRSPERVHFFNHKCGPISLTV